LNEAEARSADLIIATGMLADSESSALRELALSGKTILIVPPNPAAGRGLARLVGLDHLELTEGRPTGYAMLSDIDFRHPIFAPFADPRFSDFTRIHFWHYRKLDAASITGARIVAKFDTGDPAMLEVPTGKGRIVVLASGWQPEDSQLALSTKFVPILYALLEQGASSVSPVTQYLVGDPVPLRIPTSGPVSSVLMPDGSKVSLANGQTNFNQTIMPGIYSLDAGQGQPVLRWAVNLDPRESRTAPLALDELERLGVPSASQPPPTTATARLINLKNADLEVRQKLWRWCIIATLALLLVESWLSGRTARQSTVPAG
jgi:hypothetical protein